MIRGGESSKYSSTFSGEVGDIEQEGGKCEFAGEIVATAGYG